MMGEWEERAEVIGGRNGRWQEEAVGLTKGSGYDMRVMPRF